MTGPSVVSIARIAPDLARRYRDRVQRVVARDDPRAASDDLRCFIAIFGHGDGVPESIDRVRRVPAARTPDRLRPPAAGQLQPHLGAPTGRAPFSPRNLRAQPARRRPEARPPGGGSRAVPPRPV